MKYYEVNVPYVTFRGPDLSELLREIADYLDGGPIDCEDVTNIEIRYGDNSEEGYYGHFLVSFGAPT